MENATPKNLASVRLAIRFLWASWAVTFISWILIFALPASQTLQIEAARASLSLGGVALVKLCGLVFWTLVIYIVLRQLAKGRNWARMLCLAAIALQIALGMLQFLSHFGQDNSAIILISFAVHGLHLLFDCCALFLLFIGRGKYCFNQSPALPH